MCLSFLLRVYKSAENVFCTKETRVVHLMTPVIGTAHYTITQQVLSLYQVSCKYDKQTDRREIQSTLYVRYTMAKLQVILPLRLWQRQSMCRDTDRQNFDPPNNPQNSVHGRTRHALRQCYLTPSWSQTSTTLLFIPATRGVSSKLSKSAFSAWTEWTLAIAKS